VPLRYLVGQLHGDALAKGVEMAHQLGQGASRAHGRGFGAGGLQQGEDFKLLGVGQSLAVAHHRLPRGGLVGGMIDQHNR
jgi:hypothetical protein